MKKVIFYSLTVVLVGYLYSLFMHGFFHPKKISIGPIEIKAPDNTFLLNAYIENKEVQNLFSPLFFSNRYEFPIDKNVYLLFAGKSKRDLTNFLLIEFSKEMNNELIFDKTFSLLLKDKKHEKINSKQCLVYAFKDQGYHLKIFNRKKLLEISLSSNKNSTIDTIMHQFCD